MGVLPDSSEHGRGTHLSSDKGTPSRHRDHYERIRNSREDHEGWMIGLLKWTLYAFFVLNLFILVWSGALWNYWSHIARVMSGAAC